MCAIILVNQQITSNGFCLMRKIVREYQQLCRAEGVALLGIKQRSRHVALQFERGFLIAASTPSDHRARHNLRAAIRRLHA